MAEIGLPGQQLAVLDGGDVDAATGRLLTVAELQAALVAAQVIATARATVRPDPGTPAPAPVMATPAAGTPAATAPSTAERPESPKSSESPESSERPRRWSPRWRSPAAPQRPPMPVHEAASLPGAAAPAGFTGAAAVRAWSWLTGAPDPSVLVCAAGGGVGATTVVAVLAGLIAAARPDRVLAGAQWWPQLTARLPADTAVVADLGSLEHRDTNDLLLAHSGPTVMVARADSAGVTAALAAMTELDAAGLARRPVLVLCDAAGSRPGVLRTAKRLAATAADVLVLPKAPALRRGPVPIGGWDRALSDALAELVCALARSEAAAPADHRPLPLADATADPHTGSDTGSDTAADETEASMTEKEMS